MRPLQAKKECLFIFIAIAWPQSPRRHSNVISNPEMPAWCVSNHSILYYKVTVGIRTYLNKDIETRLRRVKNIYKHRRCQ